MVDNFDLIRSLLNFRSEDDFYFLQILQRKKDHNNGKVNGSNNNARLIKAYYIHSLEYFDFIKPEVIELCKLFGARANINLNRRSYEDVSKKVHIHMAEKILLHKDYQHVHSAWNTVCGQHHAERDKLWLWDFDEGDAKYESPFLASMMDCRPGTQTVIAKIPSRAGFHLITTPFDLKQFGDNMKELGFDWSKDGNFLHLHRNNPTNLFIP
jgi:hypothetical protein